MKPTTISKHKDAATSFLRLAASGKSREAFDTYADPSSRHHNPHFRGDAASLAKAMDENAAAHPDKRLDVQHVVEEGDLVAVHSRVRHDVGGPEATVVHVFRFAGDRIIELWDVRQEVPKDSPNEHGAS